jgi:hypothetical protein
LKLPLTKIAFSRSTATVIVTNLTVGRVIRFSA